MTTAKDRAEFEKASAGLPTLSACMAMTPRSASDKEYFAQDWFEHPDLEPEIVCLEPVDGSYFRDRTRKQRCVVRLHGRLYLSTYD